MCWWDDEDIIKTGKRYFSERLKALIVKSYSSCGELGARAIIP